jgi:hypothetical protein
MKIKGLTLIGNLIFLILLFIYFLMFKSSFFFTISYSCEVPEHGIAVLKLIGGTKIEEIYDFTVQYDNDSSDLIDDFYNGDTINDFYNSAFGRN